MTRLARQELADFKEQVADIEKQSMEEKIARKMDKLREKQERKKEKKAQQQKAPAQPTPVIKPIAEDDYVRIKGQTSVGQVLEINGKMP